MSPRSLIAVGTAMVYPAGTASRRVTPSRSTYVERGRRSRLGGSIPASTPEELTAIHCLRSSRRVRTPSRYRTGNDGPLGLHAVEMTYRPVGSTAVIPVTYI